MVTSFHAKGKMPDSHDGLKMENLRWFVLPIRLCSGCCVFECMSRRCWIAFVSGTLAG